MNTPDGISMSILINSRMPPSAELKVPGSFSTVSTSSKRLTAKKSCSSL